MRLAPPVGGRRLTAARKQSRRIVPLLFAALTACWLAGACRRTARDVSVEWTLSPTPPPVDRPAMLSLRLFDNARRPLAGAKLRIEAHMSHPGMAPVLASAMEPQEGVYVATFRFTMRGDWILLISGTLPDGKAVQHRIDVPGVGASG